MRTKPLLIIIIALFFTACKKEVKPEPESDSQIAGAWQLTSVMRPWGWPDWEDVSEKNIVYTFNNENVLIINDLNAIVYPSGEYIYELKYNVVDPDNPVGEKVQLVLFQGLNWIFTREGNDMILSNSFWEGIVLNFKKK